MLLFLQLIILFYKGFIQNFIGNVFSELINFDSQIQNADLTGDVWYE